MNDAVIRRMFEIRIVDDKTCCTRQNLISCFSFSTPLPEIEGGAETAMEGSIGMACDRSFKYLVPELQFVRKDGHVTQEITKRNMACWT